MKGLWAAVAAAIVCIGAGGAWYWKSHDAPAVKFRMDAITRGEVVRTITATGTVEPQEVVDVGAQVEGQIISFGTDDKGKMVDYGSSVEAGTVLARIDDSLYAADNDSAKATLAQAQAGVLLAQADLQQMEAKLDQAASDWERAQKLGPSDALSRSDYNSFKAAYETAKANVAVSQAAIEQAKATVTQSESALKKTQESLAYCTIASPVKGVIIDRRVNIGETVVSSLNTPSLFLIAKDLTHIQVWVSVNEADIGEIFPGQPVTFHVDAYPGETFVGSVNKARLNATMTSNVVTYTVEVNTENVDGRLLPYLSAIVLFEAGRSKDVLLAPNSALRWYPDESMVAPDVWAAAMAKRSAAPEPAAHHPTTRPGQGEKRTGHGTIWVVDGKYVRPIEVTTGITDEINTEVSGAGVSEGLAIVSGEAHALIDQGAQTTNPFAPQVFRRPR